MVVACSLGLVRQFAERGVDAHYLPHGCDESFFTAAPELPAELVNRPRPFVGYVGGINSRIDPAYSRRRCAAPGAARS